MLFDFEANPSENAPSFPPRIQRVLQEFSHDRRRLEIMKSGQSSSGETGKISRTELKIGTNGLIVFSSLCAFCSFSLYLSVIQQLFNSYP